MSISTRDSDAAKQGMLVSGQSYPIQRPFLTSVGVVLGKKGIFSYLKDYW